MAISFVFMFLLLLLFCCCCCCCVSANEVFIIFIMPLSASLAGFGGACDECVLWLEFSLSPQRQLIFSSAACSFFFFFNCCLVQPVNKFNGHCANSLHVKYQEEKRIICLRLTLAEICKIKCAKISKNYSQMSKHFTAMKCRKCSARRIALIAAPSKSN